MSDIWTQFDDWEKDEPLSPLTKSPIYRKHRLGRVWNDCDSSNDPRSSDSEKLEDLELSTAGRQAWALSPVSMRHEKQAVSPRCNPAYKIVGCVDLTCSQDPETMKPILPHQLLINPMAFEDPETEQLLSSDSNSIEDPLKDFDVESGSEKDFLIYCLSNDTPKEDIDQFEQARRAPTPEYLMPLDEWNTEMTSEEWNDTLAALQRSGSDWQEFKFLEEATTEEINARISQLILGQNGDDFKGSISAVEHHAPYLVLQKKVEEFANCHKYMLNNNLNPTTLQRRQFTRDIYDYARALGMSKNQADVEIARARAAYRYRNGLPGGMKLDETDDESTLGMEVDDAVEHLRSLVNGIANSANKVCKETTELLPNSRLSPTLLQKRKSEPQKTAAAAGKNVMASADTDISVRNSLKWKEKRKRRKKLNTDFDHGSPPKAKRKQEQIESHDESNKAIPLSELTTKTANSDFPQSPSKKHKLDEGQMVNRSEKSIMTDINLDITTPKQSRKDSRKKGQLKNMLVTEARATMENPQKKHAINSTLPQATTPAEGRLQNLDGVLDASSESGQNSEQLVKSTSPAFADPRKRKKKSRKRKSGLNHRATGTLEHITDVNSHGDIVQSFSRAKNTSNVKLTDEKVILTETVAIDIHGAARNSAFQDLGGGQNTVNKDTDFEDGSVTMISRRNGTKNVEILHDSAANVRDEGLPGGPSSDSLDSLSKAQSEETPVDGISAVNCLSELISTNTDKLHVGRRDRGRRNKQPIMLALKESHS